MEHKVFNPEIETGRAKALWRLGLKSLPLIGNLKREIIDAFNWEERLRPYRRGKKGSIGPYDKMLVIENQQLEKLKEILSSIDRIKDEWLKPEALAETDASLRAETLREWASGSELVIKITKEKAFDFKEMAEILNNEEILGVKFDKKFFFNPKALARSDILNQLITTVADYKKKNFPASI